MRLMPKRGLVLPILAAAAAGAPGTAALPQPVAVLSAMPPAPPSGSQVVFEDRDPMAHPGAADGWSINRWGNPAPRFDVMTLASEPRNTASPAVQRFSVASKGSGDAQLVRPFTASYGRVYQLQLQARALAAGARVTFGLRSEGVRRPLFGSKTVALTSAWQDVSVTGRFASRADKQATARVIVQSTGIPIEIRDARLVESSRPILPHRSGRHAVSGIFFGMTVNKLGAHQNWPGLDTRIIRLWDTGTRWNNLEPEPGKWDFSRSDMYVDYAERHGAQVLFTLGQTPAWAAADPNAHCSYEVGCSPPANLEDWRNYVHVLATRYGSRVRYWELWNEPNYRGFWQGSPEQLAQMAAIARQEIQRANPNAELIGPAATITGVGFLDRFLASPGAGALSALSFHAYPNGSLADWANAIDNLRTVIAAHGRENLPLWNTEFGVNCKRDGDACDGAHPEAADTAIQRTAAALFVMAAQGVTSAEFFFWERGLPKSPFALTTPPDYAALTPAGHVYAAAVGLLDGAVITESFENDGLTVVRFSNKGKNFVALWSESRAGVLHPPDDWRYTHYERLGGGKPVPSPDGYLELPAGTVVIGST
jgi:hypothetical protein